MGFIYTRRDRTGAAAGALPPHEPRGSPGRQCLLCLISPHLSELTRDGVGTDAQLGLQARTDGGVVVAAGGPHDLTGTEVGGLGEDHGSVG